MEAVFAALCDSYVRTKPFKYSLLRPPSVAPLLKNARSLSTPQAATTLLMAFTTSNDESQREQASGGLTDESSDRSRRDEGGGQPDIVDAGRRGHVNNPFLRWDTESVDQVTELFVRRRGLQDHGPLFRKAGRILIDPERWQRYVWNDLQPKERTALEREFLRLRHQPKALKVNTVMFCVGALVQGWSQIIATGANIQWPADLGLLSFRTCQDTKHTLDPYEVWIFSLVNASTYFAASFIGCWLSDPMSDLFLGRRAPIFISATFVLAASIGSACCGTWQQLLACRILLGIGMGGKATVLPVYAQEMAPSHLRGTIVVNWQIFVALGICLGFASNLIVYSVRPSKIAWRLQNAALCFPTLVLLGLVYVCSESPRFQMRSESNLWGGSLRSFWSGSKGLRQWISNTSKVCYWLARACVCQPVPPIPSNVEGREDPSMLRPSHAQHVEGHLSANGAGQQMEPERSHSDPRETNKIVQYDRAFETLVQLRGAPILAAKELLYTDVQMVVENRFISSKRAEEVDGQQGDSPATRRENRSLDEVLLPTRKEYPSYFQKITHLWTVRRLRRATGSALVCMLSQQFCGVNVLIFYCTTLYASKGLCGPDQNDRRLALLLSFGIGLVNFVFAVPAYWLIRRPGRQSLLLATLPFMTAFMLGACLGYQQFSGSPGHVETLATFTFLFMVAYSLGMGPVPFTISSEVFPQEYRMVGMSFSVFANLLGAGVLALIVPPIYSSRLHNQGLLAIITVLNSLAFLCILVFVRETAVDTNLDRRGYGTVRSLEELSSIFSMPIKEYLRREDLRTWAIRYALQLFRKATGVGENNDNPRVEERELENLSSSTERADGTSP